MHCSISYSTVTAVLENPRAVIIATSFGREVVTYRVYNPHLVCIYNPHLQLLTYVYMYHTVIMHGTVPHSVDLEAPPYRCVPSGLGSAATAAASRG